MKPLPLSQWDNSLRHIVDEMNGSPLNIHALMANHPRLLNAWWTLRNYSVHGGDLSQRDCELVILRVAVHMRCSYEWASHVVRGLAAGLSVDEINRVKSGPDESEWSGKDAVLLHAVDELIAGQCINEKTQQALAAHFSDNQVMDVIAIHGMYVSIACMINTWPIDLDAGTERRLPESMSIAAR